MKRKRKIVVTGGTGRFGSILKKNKFNYKMFFPKKNEVGIMWNDKNLKIKWPTKKPLVSKKDKKTLTFNEFCKNYLKNN